MITSLSAFADPAEIVSARPPATWGDAMEVPLIVLVAVLLPAQAAVIDDPGAKISRHDPWFENDERESDLVVDPTVIATGSEAGE